MTRRHLAAILAVAALLALSLAAPAATAERQPFTAHDLVTLKRLSDPQVSPDGTAVAFVLRTTDLEADRGRTDLWRVDVSGEGAVRWTTNPANDYNPRWAPDGSGVYFLSTRTGSAQVFFLPAAGGEARQVSDLPVGLANLVVSPDGERLAVTAAVFPDCDTPACTEERLAAREEEKATGRVYDELLFRHWDTWDDGRRSQLLVLPLADGRAGRPVPVSDELDADVPSQPFGGPGEIAFTPDGGELVFTARDAGREAAWSTDFDLYRVPVDGGSPPENLTEANPAWDTLPVFSPEGTTLAYLAMRRPGYESDRFRIVLKEYPDGEARVLTEAWDRSVSSLVFAPDGETLYATAADRGQVSLYAIDTADGSVETLLADGHVRSPAVAGDRLVFGRDTLAAPVDLYSLGRDGSNLERITGVNDEQLATIEMGSFEQFTFAGWNGETVHGYVVEPGGRQPGESYPLAFLIHGGPQGSFGNDFHYRWNPQVYAGAGYGAVMIDFHGSVGYGQEFTDSIRDDWGGKPLEDLKLGLAAALERYRWLDGDRACALGASYGGYMVNWIAGRWPERFHCLVNHDGLFDNQMMYYATEELWFPEWDHLGPYHEDPEAHEKHNPANHVTRWKTPMLVIHGARDYRVPLTQGIATFTALQRRGVPSRFLYYPDENHFVLAPANSLKWHDVVLGWLERWVPEGAETKR